MQIALIVSIPDDSKKVTVQHINQLSADLDETGRQIEEEYGQYTNHGNDVRTVVILPKRPVLEHF